jgi:Skp family chaperone for outer membrane proteins
MSDRLALANAIEDAGIPRDKAQRVASVIFDAIHDRVATKADVQAGEAALKSELQALRHDVQGNGAATRADIAASMAELKSDVVAVRSALERQDANVEQIGSRTVSRLGALMVVLSGIVIAALHYWPPH